jgi:hypothetical protein
VTPTTPEELHAVVLAAVADIELGLLACGLPNDLTDVGIEMNAARRRALERHRPTTYAGDTRVWCGRCRPTCAAWPCDDYRDAVAGLPRIPDAVTAPPARR